MALVRASTSEQVARELRHALVRGEIEPSARLWEVGIATMFGVSRNTVREALRLLGKEGLVSHSLHRGVVVMELSEEEIRHVFRARRALEIAGVFLSADAGPEWLEELRERNAAIRRATLDDALATADLAFHAHIVSAIKSPRLEEQFENIQAQMRLSRAWTIRQRADPLQSFEIHRPVVDALITGDREQAAALLGEINDEGERRLRDAIQRRSPDDRAPRAWPPQGTIEPSP